VTQSEDVAQTTSPTTQIVHQLRYPSRVLRERKFLLGQVVLQLLKVNPRRIRAQLNRTEKVSGGGMCDGLSPSDRQSQEKKGRESRQRTPQQKTKPAESWSVLILLVSFQTEQQRLIDYSERNGEKLYVPVEQPMITNSPPPSKQKARPEIPEEDIMQLDDTKHKVYIYDLDAELSDSESSDDGKLVFLPDIRKHLRESRIPPSILANSEGELAGNKQLILYSVPSSLTVPEEQDSVRKAIIETRARARAKQDEKREANTRNGGTINASINEGVNYRDWYYGMTNGTPNPNPGTVGEDDPDAMDLG
jgi:hypothetical protein